MGAGEKNNLVAAEVMPEGFYEHVSGVLDAARRRAYAAVNFAMVEAYWEIGRSIVEQQGGSERAEYGEALLRELSRRLTEDFGKGFDERNLRFMRQFYLAFPIRNALRTELSWTHYRRLSRVADPEARMWYMNECAKSNWSTRQLERQINTMFRETDVESALISHLQRFLLELGRGFTFEARQKRITMDGRHFFIDLVFYNYLMRCFVLIDLKTGDLTHQDLGQMQMYVNYYTRELMNEGDNPPVGIVLCADKSDSLVEYTLPEDNAQIFAAKYLSHLPSKEELALELSAEYRALDEAGAD